MRDKMERTETFSGERKLGDFLKISEDLATFLQHQIKHKKLGKSMIKESSSGGLTITLEYTSIVDKNCEKNDIAISRGRHFVAKRKPVSSSPSTKKKTPSRRRRDQERFRTCLERKKERKQRKSQPVNQPVSVQCLPPPDVTITVCDPPSVTLGKHVSVSSVTVPTKPKTVPPCPCDVCTTFQDIDPFINQYKVCPNCGKLGTEESPLKPCSQCLACAYCSRECQRKDWRENHKHKCDKNLGEKIRSAREAWNTCRKVWVEHKTQPLAYSTA